MSMLTEHERKRYDRQILLWGIEAQEKLKKAKVGVVGTGGLGSTILLYLAVVGIGKIVIADKDRVELTDLNRQVLHWDKDIGKEKTVSVEEKLRQINPLLEVTSYTVEVTKENVDEIFGDIDALIDGLDNYQGRFFINEYAWKRKIPFFHGAIWGLEGRVTTFIPGKTSCLRCLYPEQPPEETFPAVGVTAGLIAIIQVTEVLKYFTGIGQLLLDQLLIYDGKRMEFMKIQLKKNPECPICGK